MIGPPDILETREFVFIIGAPRSGTTMLQILLGNHPRVATTFELTAFNRYIVPWLETWDDEIAQIRDSDRRKGLPLIWREEEHLDFLRAFLGQIYARVLETNPAATHLLEKHPSNSLCTERIRRLLPRARLLHIIRDGRDVAASMVAANPRYQFGTPNIAAAAALWKRFVTEARAARRFGSDYFEVRYEDLLSNPMATYGAALNFCRLPFEQEWLSANLAANTFEKMKDRRAAPEAGKSLAAEHYRKGQAGTWSSDFTSTDRFHFHRLAGDLLIELGYAQPDWWCDSALERYSQTAGFALGQAIYSVRSALRAGQRAFTKALRPISHLRSLRHGGGTK